MERLRKGKIVSAVTSRPDTEYNYFKASMGYLEPAATLPEYRGRNSALTYRAMNLALHIAKKNTPSVTLLKI
ncbi:MAG: hypothetical protein QXZ47_01360 [Candidatus Bathyarchaeia archaeon]